MLAIDCNEEYGKLVRSENRNSNFVEYTGPFKKVLLNFGSIESINKNSISNGLIIGKLYKCEDIANSVYNMIALECIVNIGLDNNGKVKYFIETRKVDIDGNITVVSQDEEVFGNQIINAGDNVLYKKVILNYDNRLLDYINNYNSMSGGHDYIDVDNGNEIVIGGDINEVNNGNESDDSTVVGSDDENNSNDNGNVNIVLFVNENGENNLNIKEYNLENNSNYSGIGSVKMNVEVPVYWMKTNIFVNSVLEIKNVLEGDIVDGKSSIFAYFDFERKKLCSKQIKENEVLLSDVLVLGKFRSRSSESNVVNINEIDLKDDNDNIIYKFKFVNSDDENYFEEDLPLYIFYNFCNGDIIYNNYSDNVNPSFGNVELDDSIIENGNFEINAKDYNLNGIKSLKFKVELPDVEEMKLTEIDCNISNNTINSTKITAPEGYDGLSAVNLNVNVQPDLVEINENYNVNGDYEITVDNHDGISKANVHVEVPEKKLTSYPFPFTSNTDGPYRLNPPNGYDGLSYVDVEVNVQPNLTTTENTYSVNGDYNISVPPGADGISSALVHVSVPEKKLTSAPGGTLIL